MRYLLDTSALLAHHRQEVGAETVQGLLEDESVEIFLASVTLAEFARRLHDLGATPKEVTADLAAYESLADAVLPVDAEVARLAYTLCRATPERLPLVDALIAATAAHAKATLVHRDAHLRALPATHLSQLDLASDTQPAT
jgi:predicted nucleic acid-binding protein